MSHCISDKIDISRILIHRIDGLPSKARVTTMDAANTVLQNWAGDTSAGGTARCNFQIVFEDGCRYQGHFHLARSQKRISLARHVRKQLTALATPNQCNKSALLDDTPVLSLLGADLAESAKIALDSYNI